MEPGPFRRASLFLFACVGLFVFAGLIPPIGSAQNIISTVAGGGPANGSSAISVGIPRPTSVAKDAFGNLYFISYDAGQVYKVDNSGQLSLIAGKCISGFVDGVPALNACLLQAEKIAVDASGNIFIADGSRNLIRKIDAATGIINTVAGKIGLFSYSGDGGPATGAGLGTPQGLTVDGAGNIFIADTTSQRVRRVDASTGIITTVAGTGTAGFNGDGVSATSAQLNYPRDIAVDPAGNLFIADTNNSRVRRLDAVTGIIATVATGVSTGIAVDSAGNCYFTDEFTSSVKRIDGKTFLVTTVAGNGVTGFGGDGGQAVAASLNLSNLNAGVFVDVTGNIFVADTNNFRIREIFAATGVITTIAGIGNPGDGGPATAASLGIPEDVAVDSQGNLFIADQQNARVRRVDAQTGVITTVAGGGFGGDGAPATSASLNAVTGVAVDSAGNLFIGTLGLVRRVDALTGIISNVAGNAKASGPGFGGDGGPATSATLSCCFLGVALDKSGNLFIADQNNNRIRRVDAVTGIITTVAGNGTTGFNGDGIAATSATLNSPAAVTVDSSGNLFIADVLNSRIRRVDGLTGLISTVAGNGTSAFAGDGGPATSASIYWPQGLAFDGGGNLFITDYGNYRIRRADNVTGVISTIAGNGSCCFGGDGGPATSAILDGPRGIAIDPRGNLFIADVFNNRIRRVTAAGPPDVLNLVSGNNQIGVAGQTLITPLVVKVTNGSGSPVIGIPITFAVTAGGGTLTGGVTQLVVDTDAGGLASITLNLGAAPAPNTVTATAAGLSGSPVTFAATGQPIPGIAVAPSPLVLGNVPIMTSAKNSVTITSTGPGSLTVNSISIVGANFTLGNLPSLPLALGTSGSVSFDVTFAPLGTGPFAAMIAIASNAATSPTLISVTGKGVPITTSCVAPPAGLVSWWTGDGIINDLLGANNPSASNGVSFVPGEVAKGFTFGAGGYIDIPASTSLANQQFTWSAWARPDGPGPNNDFDGNWIVGQDIDNFNFSVYLSWRSTDNRFAFSFGNQVTEEIVSQHTFVPGQFYLVTGTYDGSTFTLYVNGQVEASRSSAKTIAYSQITWTIGASSANIRAQAYPRTWNGVIDEVQAFNRALSQSEVQAVFNAASLGECKPLGIAVAPSPVAFGNVPILTSSKITANITNTGQGPLTVNSISIVGASFTLANLPTLPLVLAPSGSASFDVIFNPLSITSSNASITITSNATTSPSTVIQVTGSGIAPPLPPATSITIATDQPVYHRGQAVQISGSLAAAGSTGIPDIAVNLQVSVNGTIRTLTAHTDALGKYNAVFQPAPNDGGLLTVMAVGTSGGATQSASATFRILGLSVSPSSVSQDLLMGNSATVPFNLTNLGDASLGAISYSVNVTPAGSVSVTLPQAQASLNPGSTITAPITVTAPSGNPPAGPVSVLISVTGTDATSGLSESGTAMIVLTLRPPISAPVLIPSSASVGVNPGGSLTQTFTVQNNGFAPISDAVVTLQNPSALSWVALGNADLGPIVPGDARQFTVVISPSTSVLVGNYSVPFTVSGGTTPLQGALNIVVTQQTMGAASFVVSDDIGTKVSGATVTLLGNTNGKAFQGVTDSSGLLTINGIDADTYSYIVVADTHDPATGTITVTAGATAQASVILSYNVVTLSFLVVPTTIVDQYNVTLNISYVTTLPKPALQVVPYSLDFSFFQENTTNGRYSCSLSITNSHPTAPVRNLVVDASQLDIAQALGQRLRVFFSNDAQVYPVGDLAAKAQVTVPCYAVIDSDAVPTHSVGNIAVHANYDFSLDGQVLQGTTTTNVPVTYTRPSDLSFGAITFTYDKRTNPANPVLVYTGDGFVYNVQSNRAPVFMLQKPSGTPFNGHNLEAFTNSQGGATTADIINGNQSTAFWHGDFNSQKQSLLGLGDTTTFDISTLDCATAPSCPNGGLTLQQALASQIAINQVQTLTDPSYLAFQGQWADLTAPSPYLIPIRVTTITPDSISTPNPSGGGGMATGCLQLTPDCKDPVDGPVSLPGGGGGQMLISIDQTIRLERQAFNATLGIAPRTALSNVLAAIRIRDAAGNDASANFFVLVTSDPLGATHGATLNGQTAVSWQLIPNAGAGGTLLQGATYYVNATLSYVVAGVAKTATTQVVPITVLPSPKLTVAYTAPFVVVPGKDAKIRVTLKNIGYGTAHNLSIQSMQPRVSSTQPPDPLLDMPGPLISSTITGSSNTADGSGFQAGNLTIRFGDVAPGATVSGYWTLQVSQRGFFIDISSTFSHTDFQGVALDPLILPPTTTLIPAIAGDVKADTGQAIPGLTVDVSQAGNIVGSDQTDASGVYYIQDLTAGAYVEEVRDLSGTVITSKNITVLGNQATDFIDFVIANYNPTQAVIVVNSTPAGVAFTADGLPYVTPHSFQWSVGSSHTLAASGTANISVASTSAAQAVAPLAAPLSSTSSASQTLVGWSDGETSATRTVTVGPFGGTFTQLFRPTAEVNQYTRKQITSDLVDHKWPSTNNLGDLVWSQKDNNNNWQVFANGPSVANNTIRCLGFVNGNCQITNDARSHERPVISDNGTIAWFQDSTGGGLGYAIERLDPGTIAPSTVEFSSRNVFCPTIVDPITGIVIPTGPCSYQEHAAGKTFGIGNDGRTISFYTFTDTNNPPPFRRFNVTGIGRLPVDSSPDDFYGFESPDINKDGVIVYADGFPSASNNIYLATAVNPLSSTVIDQGQYPHISDGPNPQITYVRNGLNVTHWPGAAPSKWVALGLWADIAGVPSNTTIVYECVVNGLSQVCAAKPVAVTLAIASQDPQIGIIGAPLQNPLAVKTTNPQGNAVSGVGISFSISQQPAGASGTAINPTTGTTGQDGTATTRLTLGDTVGSYQVTASCSNQSCVPATVIFTANALSGISVTTNVPASTFTITGPMTFSGGGTYFTQINVPAGSYTITYGAVDGYKSPPSETKTLLANAGISFVGKYVPSIAINLVDPVPGLLSGPTVSTDPNQLGTGGRIIAGVAADGVTEVLLQVQADNVGDQFALTVFDDQNQQSVSADEDGALGNPGDIAFSLGQLTTSAVLTPQGPMAFAVYRAPIDFPRASGQDSASSSRSVSIQVQLVNTGATTSVPITVLRAPLILVHGIWDNAGLWNSFAPLFSNGSPDSRFSIHLANYNAPIGTEILDSVPKFPGIIIKSARANSLGFDYNANTVLGQVQSHVLAFKGGANPAGIQAAAIQVDVVAHSMGGDITRYMALQPSFASDLTLGHGNVHKVITIDTPHLGTPLATDILQDANTCVRMLLAAYNDFAFDHVKLVGDPYGPVANGAAGDFQGAGTIGGFLSPALTTLNSSVTIPLPTALIAGVMDQSNLNSLDLSVNASLMRVFCGQGFPPSPFAPNDPLALDLTSTKWPSVFGQASDAIVPLSSQLKGFSGFVFRGYIHSDGTTKLGFGPPPITNDPSKIVPNLIINLLNTKVTDPVFVRLSP